MMTWEKLKKLIPEEDLETLESNYAYKREVESILEKIEKAGIPLEEVDLNDLISIPDIGAIKYISTKDYKRLINLETGEVINAEKYGRIIKPQTFDDLDSTYIEFIKGETPLLIFKDENGRYKLVNIETEKVLLEGEKEGEKINVSKNFYFPKSQTLNLFAVQKEKGKYRLFVIGENYLKHLLDIKPYSEAEPPEILYEELNDNETIKSVVEDESGKKHTVAVKVKNDPNRTLEIIIDDKVVEEKWLRPDKEIVSHLPPRHLDDTLALHLLGAVFNPKYRFIHPQSDEMEKLKQYENVILVDVGGDYNPKKGNFDHHQNTEIPSSIILVIEHYAPSLKTLSEDLRRFLEIADKIDRFGFPEVAKEENIPSDNTIPTLMQAYLNISQKMFEKNKPLFEDFWNFRDHLLNGTNPRIPVKIKSETGKISTIMFDVETGKLVGNNADIPPSVPSYITEEIKKALIKGLTPTVDFTDITPKVYAEGIYNPILYYLYKEEGKTLNPESLKNPYSRFFVSAIKDLPPEMVNDFVNKLKEEKAIKEEILKNVKIVNFLGLKTIVDLSNKPLRAGEYFGAYPDAGLLIQRNPMNKNHTSIVKNTKLPGTQNLNLRILYKTLGEDKEVFTHKAGFITVADMTVEEVLEKLGIKLENKNEIKNENDYNNLNAPSL